MKSESIFESARRELETVRVHLEMQSICMRDNFKDQWLLDRITKYLETTLNPITIPEITSNKGREFYCCSICGANGVRQYRLLGYISLELFCTECTLKRAIPNECDDPDNVWRIGSYGAAVPDHELSGCWGLTSTPQHLFDWWLTLPIENPLGGE